MLVCLSMAYSASAEFDTWLRQLECPQSCTTEYAKQTLQKGVLGLIWEDLPRLIRPQSEVLEARKNILLYKLKNEPRDSLIQSIRSTVHLREERKKLTTKIQTVEEKWKQQEFVCRQKVHLLEKKKAERKNLEIKKEILKIKHEQIVMQIKDCAKMQEICRHLMPPIQEEISQSILNDCLSLVSNYSGGPEKRKVWNKISESLSSVKIPVLWNALLTARLHCTDYLIHLDVEENQETSTTSRTHIDIGTAKLCSEYMNNVAKRFINNGRTKSNEILTIEYVEKIEKIIENQRPDLNDWLPLTLEVRKLETVQTELQKELEKLKEELPVDTVMVNDVLMHLISEIKAVDNRTFDRVQEIQNAFGLLKTSRILITKTKESLITELEKLQILQTSEENHYLNIDLNMELMVFNNDINVDALRKIMVKGETGVYRHLRACFNKASMSVDALSKNNDVSDFPMLRVPIYYLVDLYKSFLVNTSLNKRISDEGIDIQYDAIESPLESPTVLAYPNHGILEFLRMVDAVDKKTQQHSSEFEQILKTWSNQTVRDIVSKIFHDKVVYGATLEEWQKRYSMIIYVLQKSNINVA